MCDADAGSHNGILPVLVGDWLHQEAAAAAAAAIVAN
jgi:hypothetical protein